MFINYQFFHKTKPSAADPPKQGRNHMQLAPNDYQYDNYTPINGMPDKTDGKNWKKTGVKKLLIIFYSSQSSSSVPCYLKSLSRFAELLALQPL